ncbi:cellulose synthase [Streptosporangium sp. 'caverna']|uniref:cellulose synthase n=1 Tax=Streptosporangium sp. 'caverna' TaxID=2202249 RepID=UPI000D7E2379|nr:cellulose synthase [Streptosporangium sp. 'caverna']AWS42604.1 cellulose synthase [Streptosporangium sp. 'caverna']
MSFSQIAWLPLCAGVTGVGLVLSFLLLRRRGAAAGLRGAAWSLLPLAAYLTGALPTVWQIGTAIAGFFTGLAFNPTVWAGVAVTGLSVVLFLVSGVLRGRRRAAAPAASETPAVSTPAGRGKPLAPGGSARQPEQQRKTAPAAKPTAKPAAKPAAEDDFSDVEDILKRHGIG